MAEKMLMTQALDERDLLVKKINDKIKKIRLVDTKKKNEDTTMEDRVTPEEFGKTAKSSWQQIMDLIDRYQRLDAAILASNASQTVETSYGTFTVASAIALRGRLKGSSSYETDGMFEEDLMDAISAQYANAVKAADSKNRLLETQADNMRLSILGKDSKAKESKPLDVVDTYIRENTTEVIDPLGVQEKRQVLKEKIDTLMSELDTRIKVSNATTTIEF